MLALCACGDGGGGVLTPQPAASPTPPAIAAGTSFVSAPATVALATDTPLALPYGGDFPAAPTMTLSAPDAPLDPSAAFTVVASSAVPDGIPALGRGRALASLRAMRSLPSTGLLVLSFVSNVDLTLASAPAFRFSLPPRALVPGADYWLALYDESNAALGWQYGFAGPGALSGNAVSFAGGTAVRFPAGSRMVVSLYALPHGVTPPPRPPLPSAAPSSVPGRTPSPAPSPTSPASPGTTPTPSPSPGPGVLGAPTFSQLTMSFNGLGQTMTSTVSQAGYGGPFTVASANPSVATATISGSTVTVTSVGAGTTTIAVTGGSHKSANISVTVTTFAIGVFGHAIRLR